jgi:alanine dehydrogenase
MATGLGCDITILEVDLERMRFLDITLHSAHTLYSNEAHLMDLLPSVDLLIGAVLVPGAKAPKLIKRTMLQRMRPGSVLVDIAIDQGGCAETSHPTTHDDPVYVEEGVTHYCVANMPAAFRAHGDASPHQRDLSLHRIAGRSRPCRSDAASTALIGGINVMNGQLTCQAVAEAHGLSWQKPKFA